MIEQASLLALRRGGLGPSQAFQAAVSFHDQGRLLEAQRLYEMVLKVDKSHFGALCRLGVIRLQQSRFEDAVRLLRRAVKLNGNSSDAHHSLAFALTGLGRLKDAIRHYETALAFRPDFPEAHNNLGHALQRLGRFEEAISHYEKALAIRPDYAEALNNFGSVLHVLDRPDEAIAHYEKALALRPDYAEAHRNLGNALRELRRFEEAIPHYQKALALRPDYTEAYNGLGIAFANLGRFEEAIAQYKKALLITPDYAVAHVNLGDALQRLGRHEEAISEYDVALAIRPGHAVSLENRGDALMKLKRYDEALASFEQAFSAAPNNTYALDGQVRAAVQACDWSRAAELSSKIAARVAAGTIVVDPFAFLGYCSDPLLHLTAAMMFIRKEVPVVPTPLWKGTVWQHEKIRIAYVAVGFHEHPNAYLTAELFELHNRSRFEVLGISLGSDDRSAMRARLVRAFDRFYDVQAKSDQDIARLINELQIDIAIDRSGYSINARPGVFAYRPAPIQVNYLGYPGTLGSAFLDYVIADPVTLPFDQQRFYLEKIVHLPDCYQSNDSRRPIAAQTPTREEAGLPIRAFVFCCFNNNYKITAQIFDIWMRLLRRVEGSVLWLLRDSVVTEENLRKEAASRGVDPGRLVFAPWLKLDAHLARHRLADLFLDTLPYNAHTTASDALWAGLPLMTCLGGSFAGRVAASLLKAIGLSDLVTHSLQDYEALALRLATEPSLLRGFRERLQQNRMACPLFDTDRYRRHIEAAYTTMWGIWQRGESPRSFAVEQYPKSAVKN